MAAVATAPRTAGLNCFQNADTIADGLKAIHEAGLDAAEDPTRTDDSIDTIEKNLDKIDDAADELTGVCAS